MNQKGQGGYSAEDDVTDTDCKDFIGFYLEKTSLKSSSLISSFEIDNESCDATSRTTHL